MAESDRKWTGGQLELGQSDDQANEDLRENGVEMTENDLE